MPFGVCLTQAQTSKADLGQAEARVTTVLLNHLYNRLTEDIKSTGGE